MTDRIASNTEIVTGRHELEVTPEMIEAGLEELRFFDPREDAPETWGETVALIFKAMSLAKAKR